MIGRYDEQRAGKPFARRGRRNEALHGAVGIFDHLRGYIVGARFEPPDIGHVVGRVVRRSEKHGAESPACLVLHVEYPQRLVVHHVVGHAQRADYLAAVVVGLGDDASDAVAHDEAAHVVELRVVCREEDRRHALLHHPLGDAAELRNDALLHRMFIQIGGKRCKRRVYAVVGVYARRVCVAEIEPLAYERVKAGQQPGGIALRAQAVCRIALHKYHDEIVDRRLLRLETAAEAPIAPQLPCGERPCTTAVLHMQLVARHVECRAHERKYRVETQLVDESVVGYIRRAYADRTFPAQAPSYREWDDAERYEEHYRRRPVRAAEVVDRPAPCQPQIENGEQSGEGNGCDREEHILPFAPRMSYRRRCS